MIYKKLFSCLLAVLSLSSVITCTGCNKVIEEPETFTVTFFSDVHYGDYNYNNFKCTKGLEKLNKIIEETPDTDFYISLGDMVDYLKGGTTFFYDQVASVLKENNLNIYNKENKDYVEGNRMIYNLMGNHEAAYVTKDILKDYIPYEENVGSVYTFKHMGTLFVAVDANFDRATSSDSPAVLKTCTTFVIPQNEIDWIQQEVSKEISPDIKSIIWISHIAFKDIENSSRWKLVDSLNSFNLPLTIFEGHTHVENFDQWYDEFDDSKVILTINTLPAVTSDDTYIYYNVTFKNGLIDNIEKEKDGRIILD